MPNADWLPILVRCRDLDAICLEGSLGEILKHTLRKAELSKEQAADLHDYLGEKIRPGRALLILDGLDEIAD
ncbi:MAG TPA: hypothetical protein VFV05_09455, partial [Methylomirabilota bacterium]|nr:hypothetical protein [Methylomirabilota bacterium]